jgi:hypothetical protein
MKKVLNPKQVVDNMKIFFSQIYIQVGVNFGIVNLI